MVNVCVATAVKPFAKIKIVSDVPPEGLKALNFNLKEPDEAFVLGTLYDMMALLVGKTASCHEGSKLTVLTRLTTFVYDAPELAVHVGWAMD